MCNCDVCTAVRRFQQAISLAKEVGAEATDFVKDASVLLAELAELKRASQYLDLCYQIFIDLRAANPNLVVPEAYRGLDVFSKPLEWFSEPEEEDLNAPRFAKELH